MSNVGYFPDLAFLFPRIRRTDDERTQIALTFREESPELSADYSVKDAIERALRSWMVRDEAPEATWYHQVDEDRDFVVHLQQTFRGARVDGPLTFQTFSHFYSRCKVVISNRLHSLLLAGLCGAIPIALTTPAHQKLVALFETVGFGELVVDADSPDAGAKLRSLVGSYGSFSSKVENVFQRQRDHGEALLGQLLERLSRKSPKEL